MSRSLKTHLLYLASLFVCAISAGGQPISSQVDPTLATNAPLQWRATSIDGSEIDLAKLRGKVVLLDFWATRCPPCVAELPKVLAAYHQFHNKGFEIIGISSDENNDVLSSFVKARGMKWPQYRDDYARISQEWKINGLPTMWLINKKGLIADRDARGDLQGKVAKLLAE